jgi:hypothetical protein
MRCSTGVGPPSMRLRCRPVSDGPVSLGMYDLGGGGIHGQPDTVDVD